MRKQNSTKSRVTLIVACLQVFSKEDNSIEKRKKINERTTVAL
jgi:hypothetical protein